MLATVLAFLKKLTPLDYLIVLAMAAFGGMAVALKVEHQKWLAAELATHEALVGKLALQAKLDSTVTRTSASLKALGDSMVLFERQIIQEDQKATQLDHQLGQMQVANYQLQVQVDALKEQVAHAPVTQSADSLRANFAVEQPPYHVTAEVALPLNPTPQSQGRLLLGVTQDPMRLGAFVGCGPDLGHGTRVAYLNVTAPKYASVKLDSLTQAPEVCSPPPPAVVPAQQHSLFGTIWSVVKVAGAAVAGYFIGKGVK